MSPEKVKEVESTSDNTSTASSDVLTENITGLESLNSSDLFTSSDNEESEISSKNPSYRSNFAGKSLPESRISKCDVTSDKEEASSSNNKLTTKNGVGDKILENLSLPSTSNNEVISTHTDSVLENDQSKVTGSITEVVTEYADEEKGIAGLRLPLARVKKIMKADPYLGIASQDAVFLIAKATELFIESLASEAYEITVCSKKKTVSRKDIDTIIERIEALVFLEGAIN